MKHVFTAIQERISEMVPEVKWVDYDCGQLDHFQLRPPVLFPCALIDTEVPECTDMAGDFQKCKCTVTIRVAFEQPGQTNSKVPQSVKDKALSIFDILDKIHSAVHGFAGNDFQKILLRSITTERREDPLKVLTMRFETSYTTQKVREYKMINLSPVVTVDTVEQVQA